MDTPVIGSRADPSRDCPGNEALGCGRHALALAGGDVDRLGCRQSGMAPIPPGESRKTDGDTAKFVLGAGFAATMPLDRLTAQTAIEEVGGDPLAVNDVHSKLNPTRLHRIETPETPDRLRAAIAGARAAGRAVCIAGGRHAMGGQQFLAGGVMIDTRRLRKTLAFDAEAGIVETEAGIQWPELIAHLNRVQAGEARQWAIAQKQTGADRLTIGGALSANAHGRGLTMQPFNSDVESFTLIDGNGDMRTCSRSENAELFRLAIGGYGLFGIIYSVRLRLVRR
jgi:FAD/FMN-containing dehydrogenase